MSDPATTADPFRDYDSLADLGARPGARQEEIAPLAAAVAADLKRRGRWRAAPGDALAREGPEGGGSGRSRVTIFILLLWIAAVTGVVLVGPWPLVGALVTVGAVGIGLEVHRRRSDRERRERLVRPLCARCRYDLSGLPDDLARDWVVGSSGPRRCPECGAPWPLVAREPGESV